MTRYLKWLAFIALIAGLIWGASFVRKQNAMAVIGVSYKVKITCSEVFLAGRDVDDVLATDFSNIIPLMEKIGVKVDLEQNMVTGSLFGLGKSMAVYREGVGCTVFAQHGVEPANVPIVTPEQRENASTYEMDIKPEVQTIVSSMFDGAPVPNTKMTRGIVVVQNGKIVGEDYLDGFTKDTRQQSWSLAKAMTQSLVGILVGEDLIALDDNALLPNWQGEDPRAQITVGNLLHMASGLEFVEDYADMNSGVVQMLFNRKDMGGFASTYPLIHAPGTHSSYSSGTANIVSKLIRNTLETANQDYHAFPRRVLFDKIGMMSAIFEVDPSGGFIGSSYVYATPRDFARFGQLYLQDGVWDGERILPLGWVKYTRQPAPGDDQYASHWMINTGKKSVPGLPENILYISGNDGQIILTIPSKNAVIVHFGIVRSPADFHKDVLPFIVDIYNKL